MVFYITAPTKKISDYNLPLFCFSRCDTTEKLRNTLDYLRSLLNDSTNFKLIYRYAFDFARVSSLEPIQMLPSPPSLFFYCLSRFVFTCYSKEAEQVIPRCWLGFLSTCALPKQTDSGKKCILTKICSGRSLTALATGVEVIYKWAGNRYCSKCLLDKLGKAFPSHKTTNLHPWSSLE